MGKHCVAKILLAIRETFLCEDIYNFKDYKVSYKLAFIPFLLFPMKKKKTKMTFLGGCWSGRK